MSIFTPLQQLFLGERRWAGLMRLGIFLIIPFGVLLLHVYNSFISGRSLFLDRIIILYLLGFISAGTSAVYYIHDIYQTETETLPLRYLMASFFGLFIPHVKIKNETPESKWLDMVEEIGGPAYLDIQAGSAVLTETLARPANIFGQGKKYFMPNHERISEIVDLREQEGAISDLTVTTRDGIKVKVDNIKFNYRIWDSRWDSLYKGQTIPRNPFPYSKQAIHNYAYNRAIQLNKENHYEMASWFDAVKGPVTGIIRNYVSTHKLEDVIAPREQNDNDARQTIREKAYEADFKNSLRNNVGTILRWWDPGDFKCEDSTIEKRFVVNWSVDIMSTIALNDAHGDAQKQAYEELGRAEAEAELLTSIIHALDGVNFGKNKVQTLQNLILMRTAQVIRALNTPPSVDQLSKAPDQLPSKDDQNQPKGI